MIEMLRFLAGMGQILGIKGSSVLLVKIVN